MRRYSQRLLVAVAALCLLGLGAPALPASATRLSASFELGQYSGGLTTFAQGTPNTGGGRSATGFNYTQQTAIDHAGQRLFVTDYNNDRVLEYDLDSGGRPLHTYADHVIGQPDFSSNTYSTSSSGMCGPRAIAYEASSNYLYVGDECNNRIMVFDGGNLADGMSATFVLGQTGWGTSTCSNAANRLCFPYQLAIDDARHRLWVADLSNNRVVDYDTSSLGTGMSASNVIGQAGFGSSGWGVTQTTMRAPSGVALDSATSTLWVSDYSNNRVLGYDSSALGNGMAASYVLGQSDWTSGGFGTSATSFAGPLGLDFDVDGGRLIVPDYNNNRVLVFDESTPASGVAASLVIGADDYVTTNTGTSATQLSHDEFVLYNADSRELIVSDSGNHRLLYFALPPVRSTRVATVSLVVDPTLTFAVAAHAGTCNGVAQTAGSSVSSTALALGHVNAASSGVGAQDVKVTTNAALGYTVFVRNVAQMGDGNGHTIADVGGSNAAPGSPPTAGTAGFGYTTDDAALGTGTANRFTNGGAKWAALSTTNAEVSYAAAGPVTNDTACVAYQMAVATNTPAGTYATTVIYTAVPKY